MAENKLRIVIEAEGEEAERVASKLNKTLGETGEQAEQGSKQFKLMGLSLTDLKSGFDMIGQSLGKLKQIWDLAKQGAQIERIAAQFEASASSIGANADTLMSRMTAAVHGVVDDEELAAAASRAMTQGVITDGDQIVKALELSRAASIRFGGTAIENFERMIQSADMLSARGFKPMGIILEDQKKIIEDYARSHGLSADAIDEETQKQILFNAALVQGEELLKKVNIQQEDRLDKMQQTEVAAANLGEELGLIAADVFSPQIEGANQMATALHGARNILSVWNMHLDVMTQRLRDGVETNATFRAEMERSATMIGKWNDETKAATEAQIKLVASERENVDTSLELNRRLGALAREGAAEAATAIQGLQMSAGDLKLILAGQLGNEIERFNAGQDELKTKAGELQAKIDELNGKRWLTADQKEDLADTQTQLAEVNGALDEHAAKWEETKARTVLSMLEMRAAADGNITEGEVKALTAAGKALGLYDEATATMLGNVSDAWSAFNATGNVTAFTIDVLEAKQAVESLSDRTIRINFDVAHMPEIPGLPQATGGTRAFQHGGQFTVGGPPGPDISLLMRIRARSVVVEVRTPEQQREAAGAGSSQVGPINVTVNVQGPADANRIVDEIDRALSQRLRAAQGGGMRGLRG